ncbi:MAG TPA: glycine cleavage system protein GcvH [Actinomycetes bacterium]|nr:glycine cleavage system protein GcvH [Actinomycetes bacterium]
MYPEDLKYTTDHEWVRVTGDGTVRFGITEYAQDALGDIVYVSLPDVGASVTAGQPCGEVESTKSVSDLFAPVTGTVSARNEALTATPEVVNADPYGEGWMVEVQVSDASQVDGLLDSAKYAEHVASS